MYLTWWLWALEIHHRHHHHHRHQHRGVHVWLRINNSAVLLKPNERTFIMSQIHVDQIAVLTIQAVDSKGNPVSAAFDGPPVWTNSNEAAATSSVAADGSTDTLTPVGTAVGQSTTASVVATIGGTQFTASIDEAIVAGAVAGIKIVETFQPAP